MIFKFSPPRILPVTALHGWPHIDFSHHYSFYVGVQTYKKGKRGLIIPQKFSEVDCGFARVGAQQILQYNERFEILYTISDAKAAVDFVLRTQAHKRPIDPISFNELKSVFAEVQWPHFTNPYTYIHTHTHTRTPVP